MSDYLPVSSRGLSAEASILYDALFANREGGTTHPSDYTIWEDVYLDNAIAEVPFRGPQLSGLFSALEAKGLYKPMSEGWGEVRVEEPEAGS